MCLMFPAVDSIGDIMLFAHGVALEGIASLLCVLIARYELAMRQTHRGGADFTFKPPLSRCAVLFLLVGVLWSIA